MSVLPVLTGGVLLPVLTGGMLLPVLSFVCGYQVVRILTSSEKEARVWELSDNRVSSPPTRLLRAARY